MGAGSAADAERARGLGQAELGGEGERPPGGRDRLLVGGAEEAHRRQLGVGGDELGPGRLRLEQGERLDDRLLLCRSPSRPSTFASAVSTRPAASGSACSR